MNHLREYYFFVRKVPIGYREGDGKTNILYTHVFLLLLPANSLLEEL